MKAPILDSFQRARRQEERSGMMGQASATETRPDFDVEATFL